MLQTQTLIILVIQICLYKIAKLLILPIHQIALYAKISSIYQKANVSQFLSIVMGMILAMETALPAIMAWF
jgi:hypothetical protein